MSLPDTFKALSDPNRRKILDLLKSGSKSAGEIAGEFEMTDASVSYHLSKLKEADLVSVRKEKNFLYYELNTTVFEELMLWVSDFIAQPAKPKEVEHET